MVAQEGGARSPQRSVAHQKKLLASDAPATIRMAGPGVPCDVVAIEKRRDGGTRYWCRSHRADATAKGGTPATKCRAADITPIRDEDVEALDLDKYLGGVALWGAAPAVYDTTHLPLDRGIHVHARPTRESEKEIDLTYRAVRILGKGLPASGIVVNDVDALYFMVSSVFGFSMSYVTCTHCGWPHLDKDWFSVHPHRRHLCGGCGKHFHDRVTGIGNPIMHVRDACGIGKHKVGPAAKTLDIKQSEYPGGIQIWGSNPAFLWTQHKDEEEGIHVHAFSNSGQTEPELDDTFRELIIDGIHFDPVMVRVSMAQSVMPSLKNRVRSINCTTCGHAQFNTGEEAFVPSPKHTCSECRCRFSAPGRMRNTIANPLPGILADLAKLALRPPQQHRLDLLSETLQAG
jgi:hypothetical protein